MDRRALAGFVNDRLRAGSSLRGDLAESCAGPLLDAAFAVANTFQHGGKVLTFGNGGSAADAQHLAAEFVGRFLQDRSPLPAVALTTDSSALTAIANDYGYEHVFSRQVRALASSHDVIIGFSTSGKSPNVLAGLAAARELGATTVVFTGGAKSPASDLADVLLGVPSDYTPRIQEGHLVLEHLLCECVEALLEIAPLREMDTDTQPPESIQRRVNPVDKLIDEAALLRERKKWADAEMTVVWTNGCFDIVHAGHVDSLVRAADLGDVLVVGVNDDASVRRLKGPNRPVVAAADRALVLAAFAVVDRVIVIPDDTPERILQELRPNVHCKGADYAPPNGKPIPESSVVASYGGRVEFLPIVAGHSSTTLLERAAAAAIEGATSE